MMNPEEHRLIRDMLGAFTLGHLGEDEEAKVGWHLDSCASCRAELSSIAALAGPLKLIDPDRLGDEPAPPADLDVVILERIQAERRKSIVPVRRWAALLVAAALVAVVGGAVGYRVAPRPPVLPLESVAVQQSDPGISSDVDVVPHTWGMEIKLTARGFVAGTTYRVMVTDKSGAAVSAGEFIGTGGKQMRCNLNSSVLRTDATAFRVLDPADRTVLTSRL